MDTSLRSHVITSVPAVKSPTNGKLVPQDGKTLPAQASGIGPALVTSVQHKQEVEKQEKPEIHTFGDTREAINKINEILRERNRELEFTVDEGSGRTIVKVIHSESGEVIRQLPPEVILKFAHAFAEGSASLVEDFA